MGEEDGAKAGLGSGSSALEPLTMKLITAGRVTGRRHAAVVRFASFEGAYFVMGEGRKSDWFLNALTSGRAEVSIGESVRTVTCQEFPDDEFVRHLLAAKYGAKTVEEWYHGASLRSLKLVPQSPRQTR